MPSINILIVEDEPLIALDIARKLERMAYNIIGVCHTAEEAKETLAKESPDFAILDINLGNGNDGISVGEYIHDHLKIPFVYLTSYSDSKTIQRAKYTAPKGYLVKPFKEQDLYSTIEIALFNHQTEQHVGPPDIHLINHSLEQKITPKEYDILVDINAGCSNQDLADKHFISLNTVKTHVKKLFGKFQVDSRTQLIVKYRSWEKP
ncbi:MAG: response regulator transcription factor [Bacteroidota bacterium]